MATLIGLIRRLFSPVRPTNQNYSYGVDRSTGVDRSVVLLRRADGTLEEVDERVIRHLRKGQL